MADVLDIRIEQAKRNIAEGKGENVDWMLLINDRQCGKLDKMIEVVDDVDKKVNVFYDDRKLALKWLAGGLMAGTGGGGIAIWILNHLSSLNSP